MTPEEEAAMREYARRGNPHKPAPTPLTAEEALRDLIDLYDSGDEGFPNAIRRARATLDAARAGEGLRECEHRRSTPCIDRRGSCGTHLSPWVSSQPVAFEGPGYPCCGVVARVHIASDGSFDLCRGGECEAITGAGDHATAYTVEEARRQVASQPVASEGLDVKRPTSRKTLNALRDEAEARHITWWNDDWTRQDFIDALAALRAASEDSR